MVYRRSRKDVAAERQPAQATDEFSVLRLEGDLRGLKNFVELRRRLDAAESATRSGHAMRIDLTEVRAIESRQAALVGLVVLRRIGAGRATEVLVHPGPVAAEILPFVALAATPTITWNDAYEVLSVDIREDSASEPDEGTPHPRVI